MTSTMRRILLALVLVLLVGIAALWLWLASRGDTSSRSGRDLSATGSDVASSSRPEDVLRESVRPEDDASSGTPVAEEKSTNEAPYPESLFVSAGPDDRFWITGRVVDERGAPASEIRVELHGAARAPRATRSDPEGNFAFALERLASARESRVISLDAFALYAHRDGLAVLRSLGRFDMGPNPHYVGELALERAGALAVHVLAGAEPAAGARVWVEPDELASRRGVGPLATDAEGIARVGALPAGRYVVRAAHANGEIAVERVELEVDVQRELRMSLRSGRTLQIAVVEQGTEIPVPNALVLVEERREPPTNGFHGVRRFEASSSIPPTDGEGTTVARGLPFDAVLGIEARAPGFRAAGGSNQVSIVPEAASAIRLELVATEELRLPLLPSDVPPPPEGTVVSFSLSPNNQVAAPPTDGRIEAGHLVIEASHWTPLDLCARTSEGLVARFRCQAGEPVRFVRSRALDVLVRDDDARPVPGVAIGVSEHGNSRARPCAVTGPDGIARFRALYPEIVRVALEPRSAIIGPQSIRWPVEEVDLTANDAEAAFEIGAERSYELRVRVDGAPALPLGMQILVNRGCCCSWSGDPETGAFHLKVRAMWREEPMALYMHADGFAPARPQLPVDGSIATDPIDVAFRSGSILEVQLLDTTEDRIFAVIQRWDERAQAWPEQEQYLGLPSFRDGVLSFAPVPAGKYRAVDRSTGIASEAVDFGEEFSKRRVVIDLANARHLRGRIEVPPNRELRETRLLVALARGTAAFEHESPRRYDERGEFRVLCPEGWRARMRVEHPYLRAEVEDGIARASADAEPVVLRLVEAPVLSCDLAPEGAVRGETHRAHFFAGELEGEPLVKTTLDRRDGRWAIGGVREGRGTLWIDVHGFVPVVLRDLEITAGSNELGTLQLERGGVLEIECEAPADRAFTLLARARRVGTPAYERRAMSRRGGTRIEGLDDGEFDLEVTLDRRVVLAERIAISGGEVLRRKVPPR